MITIDKNIPAPQLSGKKKYPLREMEVGDSFFVADRAAAYSISACVARYKPKKFTVRKVEEKKNGKGWRCWRIK